MADASSSSGAPLPITVPADVRAKFSEIVDLILASESMNDDERRYWIDILPVMSADQITKLKDILVRERDQLAAIDTKYAQNMTTMANEQSVQHIGEERGQKSAERAAQEAQAKAEEDQQAESLLDQMKNL